MISDLHLHKSMRNSDPDAAVYWLARMLEAGEDPLHRPAGGALRQRGRGPGRSPGAGAGGGGLSGLPAIFWGCPSATFI